MHLIKKCPACNQTLRFPINKGVIRVNCKCGYQFVIDPDDSSLYKDAKIDASLDKRQDRERLLRVSFKSIIKSILDFYYQVRNFPVLVFNDKLIVIIKLILIVVISSILGYLLYNFIL